MDKLFLFACFLIPFENFVFAPSAGWAAIAPLVFMVYVLLHINKLGVLIYRYRYIFLILLAGSLITLVNFFFINDYLMPALSRMFSTYISLGLGLVSLFAFDIYFQKNGRDTEHLEKVLLVAYTVTICVGFIEFLTIKFNIGYVKDLVDMLSKRNYLPYGRVQFCFTEPSFIGMHLFGVLLPIYVFGKNKKILYLIVVFALLGILFGCGVRIIVDTAVICAIFALHKINLRKLKNVVIIFLTVLIMISGGNYIYKHNYRVHTIVNSGVYADGSFASRWFRIKASIKGSQESVIHTLLGYGFGQEAIPMEKGYLGAKAEYKSNYTRELVEVKEGVKRNNDSVSYCLFARVFSELGVIIAIIIILYLSRMYFYIKDREWKAIFLSVTYLYVQFESYAFYSIWLLLVLSDIRNRNVQQNTNLESGKGKYDASKLFLYHPRI